VVILGATGVPVACRWGSIAGGANFPLRFATTRAMNHGARRYRMARKTNQIEGYGVRGLDSKRWRRQFVDEEAMAKWAEKNVAEIHGTRMLEDWEKIPRTKR